MLVLVEGSEGVEDDHGDYHRTVKRRPILTVAEALDRRTEEYRRQSLASGYRELANDTLDLWALNLDPNPPAPRMTKRLALLDALSGYPPPKDILTAGQVLAIARRRS